MIRYLAPVMESGSLFRNADGFEDAFSSPYPYGMRPSGVPRVELLEPIAP
jgi:hypothetical protein